MYVDGKGVPNLIAVFQDYSGKAKEFPWLILGQ